MSTRLNRIDFVSLAYGQALSIVASQLSPPDRTSSPAIARFRAGIFAFAFILGLHGIWMLTAELIRPAPPTFSMTGEIVMAAMGQQARAGIAARIGLFRGDLWTENALTHLALLGPGGAEDNATETLDQARAVARRALRFAPHDARVWLLLAGLESRLDWVKRKAGTSLKMSYYTGPSEIELMPVRLRVAVASDALADDEIQQLVRRDIRVIVTRRTQSKDSILAAYDNALPAAKQFFEEALGALDPALLASIRSGARSRSPAN
jgi:hypothetical protein